MKKLLEKLHSYYNIINLTLKLNFDKLTPTIFYKLLLQGGTSI